MHYRTIVPQDDVQSMVERAVHEAREERWHRLVSISYPIEPFDPVDVFADARARAETAVLWQLPSEKIALVGVGAERELTGEGPGRFADVADQWRALVAKGVIAHDEVGVAAHPGPGPVAMGGFAFAPGGSAGVWAGFGDGWLCLPRVTYGAVGGTHWITISTIVTGETDAEDAALRLRQERQRALQRGRVNANRPGSDVSVAPLAIKDLPPKQRWLAAVERVADHIRAGRLEKAVLARSVQVGLPAGFSTRAALGRLRHDYPGCYVFGVARGDGCFIGATPERIVHLERGHVKVACMAGSTGRGATEAEDRSLGEALLADAKNVEEHKVVLRSILAALSPVCTDVHSASEPTLRKFANVQHLYTPVTARVAADNDVLRLVSRVHPTPAIGGHPTAAALELIGAEEDMHRGWYAGPVGWMNAAGEGEFAVGLRSGLLRPGEAHLFAGCGIMGDSQPQSEYDESVLKLRPMMRALEAGIL